MQTSPSLRRLALPACLLGSAIFSQQSLADTHTWIGPAGGNWSVPGNWTGGVPTSGEGGANGTVVQFGSNTSSICNIPGLTVDQIRFTGSNNQIGGTTPLSLTGTNAQLNILDEGGGNTILSTLPIGFVGSTTIFVQVNTGILTLASNISGPAGIRVISNGANGLTLSGASNTYTGSTVLVAGTLRLNSSGFSTAVIGSITVGTGNGAGATLQLSQAQEIGDSSTVTVLADGTLNMNNVSDTIGALTLTGGTVTLGSAQLTVNGVTALNSGTISGTGTLALKGDVTATSAATTTLVSALVSLNGSRIFNVNTGTTQPELQISSSISDGTATGTLVKNGTGTLHLTTANASTYTGGTTVNSGRITLNGASGAVIPPGTLTIGDGTGALGTASVVLQQHSEIADAVNVSIKSDGRLDLGGFLENITTAVIDRGEVAIGAGTFSPSGTTTLTGGGITGSSGSFRPGGDVIAAASGSAGSVINSNLILTANRTITVNGTGANPTPELHIFGVISESSPGFGFTKQGTGTLKLESNASNTFTGPLTINKGKAQLKANAGHTVGSSLVIGNNVDAADSAIVQDILSADIATNVPVTINASGLFDLNDRMETIAALTGTGTISLPGSSTLVVNNGSASSSFGGTITGQGSFFKGGTGTLDLTKAPSGHSGILNVASGTLNLNYATGAAGASIIQVGDGSGLANSAILSVGGSNRILAPSDISVFPDGSLLLNNNTISAGDVSVASGNINLGTGKLSASRVAMIDGLIGPNTGTLAIGGNIVAGSNSTGAVISSQIALDATPEITVNNGPVATDLLISGNIGNGVNGARGLTKSGLGTLRFNGQGNSYSGLTTVGSGIYEMQASTSVTIPGELVIGNDTDAAGSAIVRDINALNISSLSPVTIRGSGILDFNNLSDRAGTLSGSGQFIQGTGGLNLGTSNGSAAFSGTVTGSGTTTKNGTGTQTFNGNNSGYTGTTNITTGKIIANGLQGGSYFISAGAAFGGEATIGSNITSVAGGTTYAPGNLSAPSVQQVAGSVNITGGKYTVRLDDTAFVKASTSRVSGNLNITACSLEVIRGLSVTSKPKIIATYGTLTGAFTTVPTGYTVNYAYNDGNTSNNIAITPPKVPDLAVLEAGKTIADGGSAKSYGTVTLKKSKTVTYTLKNTGEQTLKNIVVAATGKNAKEFKVTKPSKNLLAPGKSITFKVTFKPTAAGSRVAALRITSNDTDENPYDIKLSGTGKKPKKKKSTSLDTLLAGLLDAGDGGSNKHKAASKASAKSKASSAPTGERFTTAIDGRKYNTLALDKSTLHPGDRVLIEVSPDLLDWYSGADHTTIVTDNKRIIEIRDNTPATADRKRFIRVRSPRD